MSSKELIFAAVANCVYADLLYKESKMAEDISVTAGKGLVSSVVVNARAVLARRAEVELGATLEEFSAFADTMTLKAPADAELWQASATFITKLRLERGKFVPKQIVDMSEKALAQNLEAVQIRLRQERDLVRRLQTRIQDMQGTIRVMCRLRHASPNLFELKSASKLSLNLPDRSYDFEFDRIFDSTVCNAEVYSEAEALVYQALNGDCSCIMAYGQTGAGKTYTMNFIITNALLTLVSATEGDPAFQLFLDAVEVYNDHVYDLLDQHKSLTTRIAEDGRVDTGAACIPIRSVASAETLLQQAMSRRAVGATAANAKSSRSHTIVTVYIDHESYTGRLFLVDLAGSERIAQSKAQGDRLRETQAINTSLSCLGDVINALVVPLPHIPYRSSKLTHVLQPAFERGGRIILLVMLSSDQANVQQSLTTLRFAEKAACSKLRGGV